MNSLIKILINYLHLKYNNDLAVISFFIKLLVCISITILIIILYTPLDFKNAGLEIQLDENNLIYLNIIFIITAYFLGLIKNIPNSELVPYINLPVKKKRLLCGFLVLSYFDFSYIILSLFSIFLIVIYSYFLSFNLKIWILSIVIHCFIFQQLGILTRIVFRQLINRLILLLIILLSIFLEFYVLGYRILLTWVNSNLGLIFSIIVVLLLSYFSTNQMFKNLINNLQ